MQGLLEKLSRGQKVTIVALGDSITELTWHTRGHLNWCGYLQEALFETYGANRCRVIVSGCCGENIEGASGRLDEDVFRFDPDLVIVSYGMNDALSLSIESFRRSLAGVVDRVQAWRNCEVLLRTPNPIVNPPVELILREGQKISVEMTGSRVALYAQAIVAIAEEKGCAVVDHYSSWKRLEMLRDKALKTVEPNHLWLYMSDPIHPGPLGHLAFFRELAPLFKVPQLLPWEAPESR
jgi:lysophospholipase L1-like esterase